MFIGKRSGVPTSRQISSTKDQGSQVHARNFKSSLTICKTLSLPAPVFHKDGGLSRHSASFIKAANTEANGANGTFAGADVLGDDASGIGSLVAASGILEQSDEDVDQSQRVAAAAATGPTKVTAEVRKKAWALRSVLKVFVTKVDPNYGMPWQMCPQRSSTGSAFVIDNERRWILTNAHVVTNGTAVYVRRPGLAKKFKADILAEAKVCDLALLTVPDPGFWDPELRAVEFEEVPELQSPIAVVGYPVGGDSLSITKGIVSRLALVRYSAAARLLGIQIDAAINPGNSGGPAFSDLDQGKVAGVAFSKNVSSTTDNIGYIIPLQVVRHFLDEYEALGKHRGVPSGGFQVQEMENPAQRAYLQVPEHRSGVVVVKVDPLSAAAAVLKENDVVMEVAGEPVADDGTIVFRDDERIDYTHLIHSKHVGDKLALKILRGGQELEVHYELALKDHLVPMLHGVDCIPSFFIVGGLVFMPLTQPFLEMVFGGGGKRSRRGDIPVPVLAAFNAFKTKKGQQVVILVQILAHEINRGYKYSVVPCETFNGKPLSNLRHLARLVDSCPDRYLNFGLEGGRLITLDKEEAVTYGPQILAVNAIASDRSDDLRQPPGPGEHDGDLDEGPAPPAASPHSHVA
mmetsp:Transcript_37567/g.83659  ORF Transcript_37567/g.83659 Transcript_37567/m.83659 type:complete len:631 (-) Transcript_37567:577-2469(-)|eukprot:CAMPEP_0202899360 /NCGR_PEP_ID=MMETSP1392-20130828/7619_1 /ASSEMBLY_ACC=CAM_ASM_000868 /TAXON_ID=225041 /ORGANISM="Chlamydomonas chlamydogama, Strain SAG 11-48b" /LENGTH=630 /DNA_ID=CAMNT_0049585523 /DNA_START=53 /DNA_END=1945 /DNA_ORIENTATION=-